MNLRFSDRMGITKPRTELYKKEIPPGLANKLWSAIYYVLNPRPVLASMDESIEIHHQLWLNYFKLSIDEMPCYDDGNLRYEDLLGLEKNYFFKGTWLEQLHYLEFIAQQFPSDSEFAFVCNNCFTQELFGYRFIDNKITPITDEQELECLRDAIESGDKFEPVKTHLQEALVKFSDREKPDYRNSIKESISAVESICKIVSGNDRATLGDALKAIERKHQIPNMLRVAFDKLYAYTNDDGGIRHGLKDGDIEPKQTEAKFMLIACSAFINYLKELI
ncbi:MAG: hypothetical protein ACD_39C02122G0001 [uncultured bacterium]|nr:MAG: hypothetical protein ACD_39C02122G0001 [uncultured bacterium]